VRLLQESYPPKNHEREGDPCSSTGGVLLFPQSEIQGHIAKVKKRKSYSGAFKAKIVEDLLRGQKSLKDLAAEHGLHPNQIKNWKSLLMKRASLILEDKRHNGKSKSEA
jgi:hypothetical protein